MTHDVCALCSMTDSLQVKKDAYLSGKLAGKSHFFQPDQGCILENVVSIFPILVGTNTVCTHKPRLFQYEHFAFMSVLTAPFSFALALV